MASEFMTPSEAGRRLGLTPARVRQLADSGDLPSIRTSTGWRFFKAKQVDALARRRQKDGMKGKPMGP